MSYIPNITRKKVLGIVGILFVLFVVGAVNTPKPKEAASDKANANAQASVSPVASPSFSPKAVENKATPTPDPKQADKDYANKMVAEVITPMTSGNQKIIDAGTAGSNYDFGTAKIEIESAITYFKSAQTALDSITNIPPQMSHIHALLSNALNKYIDGSETALNGVENYNADMINQGTATYSQGTTYIQQATEELKSFE